MKPLNDLHSKQTAALPTCGVSLSCSFNLCSFLNAFIWFCVIFSGNVKVVYLDNTITGEYLDFSIPRNSMIMTNNVVYNNLNNILKADIVEVNIETKDTKVSMHDINKKVNIQSIN